jgi:hypothetical protein
MIKTTEFSAFGRKYRTRQFPATQGFAVINMGVSDAPPVVLLQHTESLGADGKWYSLSVGTNIDALVFDAGGLLAPRAALAGVMNLVYEFSFKFLETWKGVRVPSRFQEGGSILSSSSVEPMISSLIQQETATLRELEEYYSLEDAFIMFDIMTAKAVNESLAYEAASKKSK